MGFSNRMKTNKSLLIYSLCRKLVKQYQFKKKEEDDLQYVFSFAVIVQIGMLTTIFSSNQVVSRHSLCVCMFV